MGRCGLALLLIVCGVGSLQAQDQPRPTPPPDLDRAELARWLVKHGCSGCRIGYGDLSDAMLDGVDLSGALLEGTSLARARLRGAKLDGVVIEGALIDGVDLRGASLRDISLDCSNPECTTEGPIDLTGADIRGADLWWIDRIRMPGALAEGAIFNVNFPDTLAEASFENVILGTSPPDTEDFTADEIRRLSPHRTGDSYDFLQTHRPSFDCAQATADDERVICDDGQLSPLDRMVQASYTAVRGQLGDAVAGTQQKYLDKRHHCVGDGYCISGSLLSRLHELHAMAAARGVPLRIREGSYDRGDAQPRLPADLAGIDTGRKLNQLLPRAGAHSIDLRVVGPTEVVLNALIFGSNGHTCEMYDQHFVLDPAAGVYRPIMEEPGESDPDASGSIMLVDEYLWFEGGRDFCGVRASIEGVYVLDETSTVASP